MTRIVNGETHLAEVDLVIEPGSFNVLLGRTRAGKTSLLRVMAGLDHADGGTLGWGDRDVTDLGVRERDVAMVYQMFVNYPSLTVYDNIASPLRARRHLSASARDAKVREVAALLGLTPFLSRLPAELSGGQQQRTAIARALAKDASLVLLDEPLANLDYKLREELRRELRKLFDAGGATVVYATAEPDEALLLGGRTIVLDEGRVLQVGPALDVYLEPNSQRVSENFSDPQLNVIDLEVSETGRGRLGSEAELSLPAPLSSLSKGRYRAGIRANHLRLQRQSSEDLRLVATALVDEVTGSSTLVHTACGEITLTAQLPGIHRHPLGSSIELFVAPDRLLLFDLQGRRIGPLSSSSTIPAAHGTY
ncbi:MAG TPA: ABC transporter ATP-binding protein [Polyangiales bacterium]|nr:ABC transporter ATP-binding protein [Polyangiales bacterium]